MNVLSKTQKKVFLIISCLLICVFIYLLIFCSVFRDFFKENYDWIIPSITLIVTVIIFINTEKNSELRDKNNIKPVIMIKPKLEYFSINKKLQMNILFSNIGFGPAKDLLFNFWYDLNNEKIKNLINNEEGFKNNEKNSFIFEGALFELEKVNKKEVNYILSEKEDKIIGLPLYERLLNKYLDKETIDTHSDFLDIYLSIKYEDKMGNKYNDCFKITFKEVRLYNEYGGTEKKYLSCELSVVNIEKKEYDKITSGT